MLLQRFPTQLIDFSKIVFPYALALPLLVIKINPLTPTVDFGLPRVIDSAIDIWMGVRYLTFVKQTESFASTSTFEKDREILRHVAYIFAKYERRKAVVWNGESTNNRREMT